MNTAIKIKYLFNDYSWICAYRKTNNTIYNMHGTQEGFKIATCPKGYWAADPFLFESEENIFLFVEYTDVKKKKSALAVKRIFPEEEKEFKIIYEFPYHSSYPCVFEWKGDKYIIPETKSGREIVLLKCINWPYVWVKDCVLCSDIDAADCTPFVYGGKLYLLVYVEYHKIELRLMEVDIFNGQVKEVALLGEYASKVARPAGNIIVNDNDIIYARQPGIQFYGEKVQFVRIDMDKQFVDEKIINELTPDQIKISATGKIIGLHTYNRTDNFEVIDLFVKRFNLLKPFIHVFHKLRILGFAEYERDGMMRWMKKK